MPTAFCQLLFVNCQFIVRPLPSPCSPWFPDCCWTLRMPVPSSFGISTTADTKEALRAQREVIRSPNTDLPTADSSFVPCLSVVRSSKDVHFPVKECSDRLSVPSVPSPCSPWFPDCCWTIRMPVRSSFGFLTTADTKEAQRTQRNVHLSKYRTASCFLPPASFHLNSSNASSKELTGRWQTPCSQTCTRKGSSVVFPSTNGKVALCRAPAMMLLGR
jgi:hypothetical protein